MRRRYFGIQTTWYSVRYVPCPDNRRSIHDMLPHIAPATFTHGQARGTLPFGLLEECRKALQQTKADLEHTKDELLGAEVRLRTQASKMRRQAAQASGQDW